MVPQIRVGFIEAVILFFFTLTGFLYGAGYFFYSLGSDFRKGPPAEELSLLPGVQWLKGTWIYKFKGDGSTRHKSLEMQMENNTGGI
jgi:hypothetical protein